MKSTIQAVKGTREFYPETMEIRQWLYGKIRKASELFGYQEWDGPFLEKIDLYAAKSGEELVKEQAFVFPDRSGDLITLRPELTPSLARMVAQKQNELVMPLRWWSFGPFWRYERPQKGRTREFFQWNIDQIGISSPEADAEMVAICASFLKSVGITPDQVLISINHRKLMVQELVEIGIGLEKHKSVFRLIDRRDKLHGDEWNTYGQEIGLSLGDLDQLNKLLDNKELWKKSQELVRVFDALEKMGIKQYVRYDASIIRGLDYYTGIVFEAWDITGDGRAVLGGGHYDNLVGDVGGDPLPGVGFAMGDVMITLLLQKFGLIPNINLLNKSALVTVFDDSLIGDSLLLASLLRNAGVMTVCYPEAAKLPKQLKFADRMGIKVALVLGPDEAQSGQVTVKNLITHTQKLVKITDAAETVKEFLANEVGL
ncbi:MAG: histidine--tRNA ligase [Anaerolineaceae bacterium]